MNQAKPDSEQEPEPYTFEQDFDPRRFFLICGLCFQVVAVGVAIWFHIWILIPMSLYTAWHVLVALHVFERFSPHWLLTRTGVNVLAATALTAVTLTRVAVTGWSPLALVGLALAAVTWALVARDIRKERHRNNIGRPDPEAGDVEGGERP